MHIKGLVNANKNLKSLKQQQNTKTQYKHFNLLGAIPTGPVTLHDHEAKKCKQKIKAKHISFNLFIRQLHKLNLNSET